MLNQISFKLLQLRALLAVGALALSGLVAVAQDSTTATTTSASTTTATVQPAGSTVATVTAVNTAPPQLSSGVADVLKLSQARVSDDTVVAYVQSSDRGYGALSAQEIAYLHNAGVSDAVVRAMLDKRKHLAEANGQLAQQQQAAPQPAAQTGTASTSVWQSPAYAPAPAVTYVDPAPAPASSASVYYVPNTPMFPGHPYYYSYPYYYPSYGYGYGYRGYYGPSIGLSFGFGGGRWGGYHGGRGWHR